MRQHNSVSVEWLLLTALMIVYSEKEQVRQEDTAWKKSTGKFNATTKS